MLYVGTGGATSKSAAFTRDAFLVIDLKDGRIRGSFQSACGMFGEMPGNALLAFRPKAKQMPVTLAP